MTHTPLPSNLLPRLACLVMLPALFLGCGKDTAPQTALPPPVSVESSYGPITITLTAEPGEVALDRDTLLQIAVSAPTEMDVTLPDITDRLHGFMLSGQYDSEADTDTGRFTRNTHLRLTPIIADAYRVAPMAITYRDNSSSPPLEGWFATESLDLNLKPPVAAEDASVMGEVNPRWVRPETRTIFIWVGAGLLGIGLLVLLWKLVSRVKEEVALRRMSPKERAMRELSQLLKRDLIHNDQVKEFYFELTMIVRRYIERQHGVRAPEQTTEEFLAAVSTDNRFTADVISRLRAFLQAADLVKYAAYNPDAEGIGQATKTATDYIEHDAAATPQEGEDR
jgi:hypothetical protein